MSSSSANAVSPESRMIRRARFKLALILLACASPVIASYFTYYVIRPEGRVNYAELVEPQRPVGDVPARSLEGQAGDLSQLRGKWVLITAAPADCPGDCAERLYHMRQVRLTTGRERERVERAWLLTDQATPSSALLVEHEGLRLLRVDPAVLAARFPAADAANATQHIYIIDPLGNLMMRYPVAADPNQMKKDLRKLLRASRIG